MNCRHKIVPLAALALGATLGVSAREVQKKPNFILIMTDQQRADLCAREGFPLDLTPFADRAAQEGAWFNRAYCAAPASGPSRVSFLTGRYPKVTHADSNHNINDAVYGADMFGYARENGYLTALVGKNHSFMNKESADFWCPYDHLGQPVSDECKGRANADFDKFLGGTDFYAWFEPSPGTVEQQLPYRMVDDAVEWIGENRDRPFLMWLSFPEPHNPYQVCEPYFSMFEGKVPPALTDASARETKGEKFVQLAEMMGQGHKDFEKNLERLRTTYMGMIRMLDDQMARLVDELKKMGVYENTVFVIMSDHGDYAGEYGLMKKGAGLVDPIARVPMVWFGPGIEAVGLRDDHVSMVDVFPTVCEMMGGEIPLGVQGRSLKNMLGGESYPQEEFRSVMAETGYGGEYYTKADDDDYIKEGAVQKKPYFFDELNTWSQSGSMRMVRMGDWKLVYDMHGNGELYNVEQDPAEIRNLFDKKRYARQREELLKELLKWEIATVDPIPVPRNRYYFKRNPHNYLFYKE